MRSLTNVSLIAGDVLNAVAVVALCARSAHGDGSKNTWWDMVKTVSMHCRHVLHQHGPPSRMGQLVTLLFTSTPI